MRSPECNSHISDTPSVTTTPRVLYIADSLWQHLQRYGKALQVLYVTLFVQHKPGKPPMLRSMSVPSAVSSLSLLGTFEVCKMTNLSILWDIAIVYYRNQYWMADWSHLEWLRYVSHDVWWRNMTSLCCTYRDSRLKLVLVVRSVQGTSPCQWWHCSSVYRMKMAHHLIW